MADDRARRLFQALANGFESARSVHACRLKLGALSVSLRIAGARLSRTILRPLAHLEIEDAVPPDFEVTIWDSETTGMPLDPPGWQARDFGRKSRIPGMSDDTYTSMWFRSSRGLGVFNKPLRKLCIWYPDSRALPEWEAAAPLRAAFEELLAGTQQVLVHAAAIARAGRVVLLVGPGGSGKSTLALEWIKQGYSYLGDDYCIVSRERVYSLYGTAKQKAGACAMLPWLRSLPQECLAPCEDKTVVFLKEMWPDRLVREGVVSAIVALKLCGDGQPALKSIGARQALVRMAPSTLVQSEGGEQRVLSRMTQLARNVSAYELSVPSRIDRVPAYIAETLLPG